MLTVRALKRLHIFVSFDLQDGECVALQGPSLFRRPARQRGPVPRAVNPGSLLKIAGAGHEEFTGRGLGFRDAEPGNMLRR
ncbi:hypothetical protein XH99_16185 [Bradyrhizobium nanningense]|uniref:Uncharacterized protein n=1 Tax=Bradyrhizobium nanningense TaxID=1325118 RepID=A0A4Q0S3Q5_9BRAD|nr:hypothetical protein XH99_16185 [Bradyrhizobium nanningense]RXH34157.1 hypothetical protein XH84_07240 [Bradyrhizobium nanningense]